MANRSADKRDYCRKMGVKIQKEIWRLGWSQRRLASEFEDASTSTVNRWIVDPDAPGPMPHQLVMLADLFNCSLDYLLRDEVDDPSGGRLSVQQRYLLSLADRVGVEESVDRILQVAGTARVSPPAVAATTTPGGESTHEAPVTRETTHKRPRGRPRRS